jgi:transcription antitermination factor NusG
MVCLTECLPANQLQWFALFVRTKFERTIGRILSEKGFETYVPCQSVERKWADRIKLVDVPLFTNYVFCRFDSRHRFPVVSTPEVYSIVGIGKNPTPISDEEIASVQKIVQYGTSVKPATFASAIAPGERVTVVSGPLTGVQGTVVRVKNKWRLVVLVSLLRRGVAAEINRDALRPIGEEPASRIVGMVRQLQSGPWIVAKRSRA